MSVTEMSSKVQEHRELKRDWMIEAIKDMLPDLSDKTVEFLYRMARDMK